MGNIKSRIEVILRKIKPAIYLLGFTLALVGSIQVYQGQFESKVQEVVVIIYSIIKLFAFSPTESIMGDLPLVYQLAVWVAPFGTILGLMSIFSRAYLNIRRAIKIGKPSPILVLGWTEDSRTYIKNALAKNRRLRFILGLSDTHPLDANDDSLLSLGINVAHFNYDKPGSLANQLTLTEHQLMEIRYILSFEPESQAYAYLTALNRIFAKRDVKTSAFLQSRDVRIQEIMQPVMDDLSHISVHYFNLDTLLAADLFNNPHFSYLEACFDDQPQEAGALSSYQEVAQSIRPAHLLIVGVNDFTKALLRVLANQGVVNALAPIKVTLADVTASKTLKALEADIPGLENVFDLEALDVAPDTTLLVEAVQERMDQEPFTGLILDLADIREALLTADRLVSLMTHIPMAIRAEEAGEYKLLIDALKLRTSRLVVYGNRGRALREKVIVDQDFYDRAKRFNASYNRTAANLMGWDQPEGDPEAQWEALSAIKKESSYYQALHRETKRQVLDHLCKTYGLADQVDNLIASWRSKLEGKTVSDQVNIIEANPFMNFMAALEHRRWDNFYYMRHFVFDEVKNEINKKHDCLIPDWDVFMTSVQRDKAIYDFLSILDLADEGEA